MIRAASISSVEYVGLCWSTSTRLEPPCRHGRRSIALDVVSEPPRCDRRPAERRLWRGPLHGVPIGIKDNFDVAGTRDRAGSQHAGRPCRIRGCEPWSHDCVRPVRIVLGQDGDDRVRRDGPGPTRPTHGTWRTRRADRAAARPRPLPRACAPAALGSQTAGSVLRPGRLLRRRRPEADLRARSRERACSPARGRWITSGIDRAQPST